MQKRAVKCYLNGPTRRQLEQISENSGLSQSEILRIALMMYIRAEKLYLEKNQIAIKELS